MKKITLTYLLVVFFFNQELQAQETTLLDPLPAPGIALSNKTVTEGKVDYIPKLDGAVKAKMELSTYDGNYRFNVRNSRFGVSGNASRNMFYRIQVDFSNEGNVSILDAYAGYRIGGLDIRLGQQQYHFSSDLDRGPNTNMFANRSFVSKFLTSYYGRRLSNGNITNFVSTLGSRDLGVVAVYNFKTRIPLKLIAGALNGSGINNPDWGNTVNINSRFEFGAANKGLRLSGAYYHGHTPEHDQVFYNDGLPENARDKKKLRMMDVELRYTHNNFFIEGEYARRYLRQSDDYHDEVLVAGLIHSYYRFPMRPSSQLNYIAPLVRWDIGSNMDYYNTKATYRDNVDAHRLTFGVNFGFGEKFLRSEIRLNYEKYFLMEKPSDFSINKLLQDKFTIEVVATF